MRWHQRSADRALVDGRPQLAGVIHAHADFRTGTACGIDAASLRWANVPADFDTTDPRSCPVCARIVQEDRYQAAELRQPEHGPFRI